MKVKTFPLGEIFEFLPKSKHKAGDGLKIGKYPFFTSSQQQSKWFDEVDYEQEAIILGTGGMPSVHCAKEFSTSTDVFVMSPSKKEILTKYAYYFFLCRKDILEKGFKGAGLKHLSREYTKKIQVPFPVDKNGNPDLTEQKRIVTILEKAEGLKKKRAEADQKMATVVPALFSKMFGNKESWNASFEMKSLSDLVEVISGGTPSTKEDRFWSGNIPWVSAKDMKTDLISDSIDHITEEALSETTLKYIERNSVLIVVRGMILARYIPISLAANRLTINQDLKALVPKPGKVSGVFLWAMLRATEWQLKFAIKTAAHGTKKLDTSDLMEIKIPVPSIELQNQFSELVKEIEIQKEKQKQSAGKIDKIFQSLLHEVFSEQN